MSARPVHSVAYFALPLLLLAACAAPPASPPASTPAPGAGAAPAAAQPDRWANLPPLIDREIFFGDPEIAGAQLSPDGRYLTFVRPLDGVMNVWVVERGQPFEQARPLTADTARPVRGYFWSQDGRFVLYVQDKGGDENFRVYAVDPSAAPAPGARAPAARDLTPYEKVQAQIVAVPENTPNAILVGLNDRNPQLHDLYRVDLRTGKRELVFRNEQNLIGWTADLQGRLRLAARLDASGGTEILRVDGQKLTPVYSCSNEESCSPLRFHRDGRRVYLITNKGDADLTRLILFDPQTKQEELVEADPQNQVDFAGADFSNATDELVATYYLADRLRVYPKSPQVARDYEVVRAALPDGDLYFGSATEDDRLHLVSVASDVDPGATYLYDRQTGKVDFLYRPRPKLPREALASMQPVRYPARDGVEVPAYLTLPKGVEAQGLPVVMLIHGGPWARDAWGYDAEAQFLANRGYAVMQPNFRGSTGFGKRFLNLGNEQWGTGSMQHDITDGVKWLIQQGIADPQKVGIMGGSYGGYATLAGVAFTPELYAAGVSIVGPSSIPTLLRSIPPYWAPIRRIFDVRVGDLDEATDLERLKAQSPLYSATQIRAPLLVIQGANDPRVNKAESDQIVVALRDLGRPVEYLVAPDEGHGFAGRENRLAMYAAVERFLARHLGGRYQPEMPEPVQQRLSRLAVQVDTLKLASAGAAPTAEAPSFSGSALKPMTLSYAQTVEMGGQKVEVATTRSVTEGSWNGTPAWVVVERSESPMGAGVDSTFLHRETLLPLHRSLRQGMMSLQLGYSPTAVQGTMKMGPQEMPLQLALEQPVLAEGGPLEVALSTAPLAPGYRATLHTFDVATRAVKAHALQVVGAETVQVPAGSFPALKVEITPADGSPGGTTLWVEQAAPHRVLRAETKLPPQMGGGTATTVLSGVE